MTVTLIQENRQINILVVVVTDSETLYDEEIFSAFVFDNLHNLINEGNISALCDVSRLNGLHSCGRVAKPNSCLEINNSCYTSIVSNNPYNFIQDPALGLSLFGNCLM